MKKFRYKFPTALTVVTIIASVAIFGLSLFNILRLCEVGSLETFNPALDILSVVRPYRSCDTDIRDNHFAELFPYVS